MVTALKRKSARSSATRSETRAAPASPSARGSLPASPVWVSQKMFPSCEVNRPGLPTWSRDRDEGGLLQRPDVLPEVSEYEAGKMADVGRRHQPLKPLG